MAERNECLMSLQKLGTEDEEKKNSDNSDDEDDLEIKKLKEANAILKQKIDALQAERDREQQRLEKLQMVIKKKQDEGPCCHKPQRIKLQKRKSDDFTVEALLGLLCKGGYLFSAQVSLRRSDVGQLIDVYPNQTIRETCLHVERFLRHKNRFASISDLKDGLQKQNTELNTAKNKIINFLTASSCHLWTNGAPQLTCKDISEFRLLEDNFFAFLGANENSGRETPISLLKPTSIADIADATIIGLEKLNNEEKKYDTLLELVTALENLHADEIKRQDDNLEKTKASIHHVIDFLQTGVAIFSKQLEIDINALNAIVKAGGGSGAMARRKLEKLVISRQVFGSVDDLTEAIKTA